jgi:hypothetical protein
VVLVARLTVSTIVREHQVHWVLLLHLPVYSKECAWLVEQEETVRNLKTSRW